MQERTVTLSRLYQRLIQISLATMTGLTLSLSCSGAAEKVTHTINPCGVVLNCNPEEYDLLTTDFPNWNIDPTCTVPGQCSGNPWPFPTGGTTNP
jgi:hypothetical protein